MDGQGLAPTGSKTKWAKAAWLRALERTAPIPRNPRLTLPLLIEELSAKFGDAPALLDDAETLSYRGLADRVNRYACWALAQGVTAGEVVGIFAENSADYLALWL